MTNLQHRAFNTLGINEHLESLTSSSAFTLTCSIIVIMVAFSLSGFAFLLSVFGVIERTTSSPVFDSVLGGLDSQARTILERSKRVTQAAPVSTFSSVVGCRGFEFVALRDLQ